MPPMHRHLKNRLFLPKTMPYTDEFPFFEPIGNQKIIFPPKTKKSETGRPAFSPATYASETEKTHFPACTKDLQFKKIRRTALRKGCNALRRIFQIETAQWRNPSLPRSTRNKNISPHSPYPATEQPAKGPSAGFVVNDTYTPAIETQVRLSDNLLLQGILFFGHR